jgi:hypothetical protein
MRGKQLSKRNRGSLIENDTHQLGSQESRPGSVLQDVARLRKGNAREPLKKLVDCGILFKVLKQSGDRNPRATENPGTTHAISVALDVRAGRPVDHEAMVAL